MFKATYYVLRMCYSGWQKLPSKICIISQLCRCKESFYKNTVYCRPILFKNKPKQYNLIFKIHKQQEGIISEHHTLNHLILLIRRVCLKTLRNLYSQNKVLACLLLHTTIPRMYISTRRKLQKSAQQVERLLICGNTKSHLGI